MLEIEITNTDDTTKACIGTQSTYTIYVATFPFNVSLLDGVGSPYESKGHASKFIFLK